MATKFMQFELRPPHVAVPFPDGEEYYNRLTSNSYLILTISSIHKYCIVRTFLMKPSEPCQQFRRLHFKFFGFFFSLNSRCSKKKNTNNNPDLNDGVGESDFALSPAHLMF